MIDNLRGVSQQVCYDVMIMVISFRLMKWTRIHKKYSYSMIPSIKKTRKLLVDYFIRGRHKYCSIIICLRAFIKHQKTFP